MFFIDRLPLPFLKKHQLKYGPEFRKMRVPGHDKLYFIVYSFNQNQFNKVLIWLDVNSIYGFAFHISDGNLYVIVAQNGTFNEAQVQLFLKTLGRIYWSESDSGVQYQLCNQQLP